MRSNTLNPHYRVGCYTMAAAIVAATANNSNIDKSFVIGQGEVLRTMCGVREGDGEMHKPKRAIKPTEWVLHDDLQYVGQKKDNDKTYYGLVPVIGGVERTDLAIMRDNTRTTYVEHYPQVDGKLSDESDIIEIDDKLRKAVQTANEKTLAEGGTWEDWWNTLADEIKGSSIGCLTYTGRRYDNKKPYQGTELTLY